MGESGVLTGAATVLVILEDVVFDLVAVALLAVALGAGVPAVLGTMAEFVFVEGNVLEVLDSVRVLNAMWFRVLMSNPCGSVLQLVLSRLLTVVQLLLASYR